MAYRPIDFNIIQNEFEQRFPDEKLFEGKTFSYLKLVQHGFSYSISHAQNKLLKKSPFRSWFLFKLKSEIRSYLRRELNFSPPKSKSVLFIEGRRKIKLISGQEVSPITHRIRGALSSGDYSWWDTFGIFENEADFSLKNLSNWIPPTNKIQFEIFKELRDVLEKIKKSGKLSKIEFRYIEGSFIVFFESFRRWYSLLEMAKPQTAVFIMHYHNEGFLAASKLLDIKTIELQHGLISKLDLYYVYPNKYRAALSKGIFPNEIWLFGDFWKKVFEKGAESEFVKPVIVGDYTQNDSITVDSQMKENRILLCAQKNLSHPYIEWIRFMKREVLPFHPEWKLAVKMHPLESNTEAYILEKSESVEILPIDSSLHIELQKARIQVSIYSTTFYNSLGFKVKNYALVDCGYSSDYAQEMVEMKLAEPLKVFENVISKFEKNPTVYDDLTYEDVFKPFRPSDALFHLISQS